MTLRRRLLRIVLWAALIAVAAWVLFLILTRADVLVVALILLLGAAVGSGLILDRIDVSRRPPEERPEGWESHPEDYWGYRGRPGA